MNLSRSLFLVPVMAASMSALGQTQQTAPDNSGRNARHAKTADNQPNVKSDRMTTAQIRKAIVHDKGLSTYGHNVKIIVMDGKVTLKGPVHSEEEKKKVVADASSVVDAAQITDQLTVK